MKRSAFTKRIPLVITALALSLAGIPAAQAGNPTTYTGSVGVDPGFFTWITIGEVGMWTGTCLPAPWKSGTAGLPGSIGATTCSSYDSPVNIVSPDAPEFLVVTDVTCFFHDFSIGGSGPLLAYTEHGVIILSDGQVTAYCPAGTIK